MKSRLIRTTLILLIGLLSIVPISTNAQGATTLDLIRIDNFPTLPSQGQQVKVSLESYATDLNGASIIWLIDGKTYVQGIGKTSITVTAPQMGKVLVVTAIIMTIEGKEVKKILTIKSSQLDIIWESQGYVPPFYKGKSTYAYQNQIRISAIPHMTDDAGALLDPKTLLYKWTVNDKVLQAQSGYGKQSVMHQEADLPKDLTVQVEVMSRDGRAKASGSITLEPGDPSVSFYEENPLYGVLYNKALLKHTTLAHQEITVRAIPYSFNVLKNAPLLYTWSINGKERDEIGSRESIVLRTKGDKEGSSNISLNIKNPENILQGAQAGMSIIFNRKSGTANNFTF